LVRLHDLKNSNLLIHNEVDLELKLWQAEVENQNLKNSILWNILQTNFRLKSA
jgi:hypothetical protein